MRPFRRRTAHRLPPRPPVLAACAAALLVGALAVVGTVAVVAADRPSARAAIRAVSGAVTGAPEAPGEADGHIPVGASISPFADVPAIAKLDPALRDAVRRAAVDARRDGIALRVNSGWRSARYQQSLLDRAVANYRSEEVARRYVTTPEKSAHVRGAAVDVGPTDADSWLSQHGSAYGLCQVYANEMWHFERATEPGGECPAQIPDASAG